MCACMSVYVCMYVCMYACMYVWPWKLVVALRTGGWTWGTGDCALAEDRNHGSGMDTLVTLVVVRHLFGGWVMGERRRFT